MKPPYFSLTIRLLFSDLFRIRIRIPIRIRIRNPDPKQDPKCLFRFRIGSGSGQKFRIRFRIRNTAGSIPGTSTQNSQILVRVSKKFTWFQRLSITPKVM